jgi:hypothetical protein
MADPRTKYPKPPFKPQTQPWPGLARNMDPKPDHGETSYRGSGRLVGRKAPIWTPLQISGGAPEQKYEHFGSTAPLGRPGQPVELASIYVQLAASDASFTTGNIYGAGGGQGQP